MSRREPVDSSDQGKVLDVPLDDKDESGEYEPGVHITIPVADDD